jgi:hypothetical protein
MASILKHRLDDTGSSSFKGPRWPLQGKLSVKKIKKLLSEQFSEGALKHTIRLINPRKILLVQEYFNLALHRAFNKE